jgi:hypothetical protein
MQLEPKLQSKFFTANHMKGLAKKKIELVKAHPGYGSGIHILMQKV